MTSPGIVLATALVATAAAGPAAAQPAQRLGLGRVLAASVSQNPELARASVDVERANAAAFEAAGIDDWLLAATAGLLVDRNEAVEGNVVGTDALDAYSVSAEISRLLTTGGRFGLGMQGRRRRTVFAAVEDTEAIEYNGSLALRFEQPLLRGRGERVARANVRHKAIAVEVSLLEKQSQVREVVRQVIHAYWDVALAWENLRIRNSSLELAREHRRITQAAIEAGTTAPTEALAVEQIINTREEEILAAELAITQRSLELRRIAYLEIGPGYLDVLPTAAVAAGPVTFDEAALIERAIASSPEMAALQKRGIGATLEVEVAENGLLPSLDASLSFGPQGTDSTMLGAAENLARLRGYSVSANLSYQQRLENRSARGLSSQARAQRRLITIDTEVAKRQIALAVAQAVRLAVSAQKRIQIGERTISLAERNVQTEKERFELGRSTNFDVLQRQEELKQAQLRLVGATVDLLKAQATIDSLTGDLLDKYGIKVAGR